MAERILTSRTLLSTWHCPACGELAGQVNGSRPASMRKAPLVTMLAVFDKAIVLPLFCCVVELSLIISESFLIIFENQFLLHTNILAEFPQEQIPPDPFLFLNPDLNIHCSALAASSIVAYLPAKPAAFGNPHFNICFII